jgi:chorismate synthase
MLRYWTAGESHGKAMLAIIDGFPAGLEIDIDLIDEQLRRRQGGYGRGGRQRIETDRVEILSGIWHNTRWAVRSPCRWSTAISNSNGWKIWIVRGPVMGT